MSYNSGVGVRGDRWDPFEAMILEGEHDDGPHVGKGPRNYRRSDERIQEEICMLLERSGDVDATGVEVIVTGGEVFLMGFVSDRQQKRLTERIADLVSGVRDVHNRLEVPPDVPTLAPEDPTESVTNGAARDPVGDHVGMT